MASFDSKGRKAVCGHQPNISATAPGNVIYPAAFAGKPVVVNPERKGGHATRMRGVIGLRHRRNLRQADAKLKAAREAAEKLRGPEELRGPLSARIVDASAALDTNELQHVAIFAEMLVKRTRTDN